MKSKPIVKLSKKEMMIYFLKKKIIQLKPINLFNIHDEEVDTKKFIDISIIVHLLFLIFILVPLDELFPQKFKKVNNISVGVISSEQFEAINKDFKLKEKNTEIADNNIEIQKVEKLIEFKPEEVKESLKIAEERKKEEVIEPVNGVPIIKKEEKKIAKQKIEDKKEVLKIKNPQDSRKLINESDKKNIQKTDLKNLESVKNMKKNEHNYSAEDIDSIQGSSTQVAKTTFVSDKSIISNKLHSCWISTQVSSKMSSDIVVTVVVEFSLDGKIVNYSIKEKTYESQSKIASYLTAKNNAIKALNNCSKISGLNSENYHSWKKVVVNFTYSKVNI